MTETVHGYCRFCVALCGIRVTVENDQVVDVRGDEDHPASRGYTCAKGRGLGRWHHHPQRILSPRIRSGAELQNASWDEALGDASERLRAIISESGVDAVGTYLATASSFDAAGRWASERLTRVIGSRSKYTSTSIDTPCKPLVSQLMSGFPGLVPILDDKSCTLSVFVGCNPVVSHGHLNALPDPVVRLRELSTSPKELWVIDSRVSESSRLATRYLVPRPGSDFAIFAYVIHELFSIGGIDREYVSRHTHESDLAALQGLLSEWTLERASAVTGCRPEELRDFSAAIRRHGKTAIQTGTGTTMSGTANLTEWLIWVTQILTGSYDTPGGMWFHPGFIRQLHTRISPNTKQPQQKVGPKSRPELPIWGDEFPCSAMADEIEAGNLRALIVFGGNPVSAFPNTARMQRALERLDALIVLDVVETETTPLASHIFPTKGQLERADVPYFVDQFNLDNSTQFTPAIAKPVGDIRSMWWIAAKLAEGLDNNLLPAPLTTESSDLDVLGFIAGRAAASFEEIQQRRYIATAPIFGWVLDRVLPGGKWSLVPDELVTQFADWQRITHPKGLLVTSRRQPKHLNSQHIPHHSGSSDSPLAIINTSTALGLGIKSGDDVIISTKNGELRIAASLNDELHADVISLPHGWRDTNVSLLTSERDVDPLTGMVIQTAFSAQLRAADDR